MPSRSRTWRCWASMATTSPSRLVTLRCLRNRKRTGAAMAGADSPAVATWYSSGWNRWWLARSTSVTSTGAACSARAASRPPKPQPTISTRGRGAGFTGSGMRELWRAAVRARCPTHNARMIPLRLSVLDQSVARAGIPQDQSIRDTVALAEHCEALGYARFWLSEHHGLPTIVGTAPEVLMAAIAVRTTRIRIGSAGVMLPHYSPFKVAEQFRVLDALAPGRIDLGVGRAPGSDYRTALLLNPDPRSAEHFPQQVRELHAWVTGAELPDGHAGQGIRALPMGSTAPQLWMLGSS